MNIKNIIHVFLVLLICLQINFAQNNPPKQNPKNDALSYFDKYGRWYNDFTEHWFMFYDIPSNKIRESITHFEKIGEDIKQGNTRWAGTFGNGGTTFGNYVRWSKQSGFIWLNVNKCNGGPIRIVRGKVEVLKSSVKFVPEEFIVSSFQTRRYKSSKKPIEFLFVKWRKVKFLIKPTRIKDFTDFTAGLNRSTSGFNDGGFYFSEVNKDYVGSVNALPIAPKKYRRFIKSPFRAIADAIHSPYRRNKPTEKSEIEYDQEIQKNYDDMVVEIKINLGTSSGIKIGTVLESVGNDETSSNDLIVVTKIFRNHSIAEYVEDIPKPSCKKSDFVDCKKGIVASFKIGQKFSTTGIW